MNRKSLDRLLAAGGLLVAAILLLAGALLSWAHSYVHDQVRSQLAAQQIYFPAKGSPGLASSQIGPYLDKYAGQQLLTGAEAKAWANHYIAVHLQEMTGGQTYAQLSAKSIADPTNTTLSNEVETVFRGDTLRGLLLNAYAFDTVGNVAGIAAVLAYIGAAGMASLSGLGIYHANRVNRTAVNPTFPAHEMISTS